MAEQNGLDGQSERLEFDPVQTASAAGSVPPQMAMRNVATRKRSGAYLIAAGWLITIAGILALINGFGAIFEERNLGVELDLGINRYSACGSLIVVIGVVAIAGGLSAITGRNFSLALAGAACGTVGDGVVGFWLGIAALVLLFLSNEDL